jgi:hypothetical protein
MIPGSDVLIITVDEARAILAAMREPSTPNFYERLQRVGALKVYDELRDAIRRIDAAAEGE